MYPVAPGWPENEECGASKSMGFASYFDRLVANNIDAVSFGCVLEQSFKIPWRFTHCQRVQREPSVSEGIESIG